MFHFHPSSAQALQAQLESRGTALAAAEEGRVQAVQQLQAVQREHTSQASELRSTADALRNALEDQRADGAEELHRVREQLGAQVRAAQAGAEAAHQRAAQLGEEIEEARAALEVQHAALQQQLEAICADKERRLAAALGTLREEHARERQQWEAALGEALRNRDALQQRHAALQELAGQQAEELAASQVGCLAHAMGPCCGTNTNGLFLHKVRQEEEAGAPVMFPWPFALATCSQGEMSGWAAQREQLQAQLDAAERRAAVLAAGQGPSLPELEGMLRRLTGQRDTAQAAAAEAQARLASCEAEVQRLQQQLAGAEEWRVRQEHGGEPFSWPTPLSTEALEVAPFSAAVVKGGSEGLASGVVAASELAALQAALAEERQQSQQLQAALHALTADMQRLQAHQQQQQQQQQQQAAIVPANSPGGDTDVGHALTDVTNHSAPGTKQRDALWLAKQLAKAESRLRQLAAENERLMELSNSLRAEKTRLAAAASEQQAADRPRDGENTGSVQGPLQLFHQAAAPPALPMITVPPGLWPLLALTGAGRLLASVEPAAGSPQQLNKQRCIAAQQLTAGPCSAHRPAAVLKTGGQDAAEAGACTAATAEPVAVAGTRVPEAGSMAPANSGGARTNGGNAATRPLSPVQPREQQRGQQMDQAKAPSPLRVRNYNIKSP